MVLIHGFGYGQEMKSCPHQTSTLYATMYTTGDKWCIWDVFPKDITSQVGVMGIKNVINKVHSQAVQLKLSQLGRQLAAGT